MTADHIKANSRQQEMKDARGTLGMTEEAFARLLGFKTASQFNHKAREGHYWTDEQIAAARAKIIEHIGRRITDLQALSTNLQAAA